MALTNACPLIYLLEIHHRAIASKPVLSITPVSHRSSFRSPSKPVLQFRLKQTF